MKKWNNITPNNKESPIPKVNNADNEKTAVAKNGEEPEKSHIFRAITVVDPSMDSS
jgi:hypothetical protein